MPRLYAVQHCHRMRGWEDLVYFHQWATAVRASELAARDQPGLVTRVIRKPHGFEPPPAPVPLPTPSSSSEPDPVKLRRKYQKQRSREAGAKARIPTWYDRLLRD